LVIHTQDENGVIESFLFLVMVAFFPIHRVPIENNFSFLHAKLFYIRTYGLLFGFAI